MHRDTITVRRATQADAAFLAQIDEIAGSVPAGMASWDALVEPLETTAHAFLEAVFAHDASNWGAADDFIILELNGQSAAGCAVYEPVAGASDGRPLRLERLPAVAHHLNWTDAMLHDFIARYEQQWGPGVRRSTGLRRRQLSRRSG